MWGTTERRAAAAAAAAETEKTAIMDVGKRRLPRVLKIAVPALVIVLIAAMYIVKNYDLKSQAAENGAGPDALRITSVDLRTIRAYGLPAVIDFGSDSCVPCRQMAPVLETLNAEWRGKAVVQFMDVWKYKDGVENFPLQVIPTQVFFRADGKPFVPSEKLAGQIAFTMYADENTKEHIFTVHQGAVTEAQMRSIFAEMGVK